VTEGRGVTFAHGFRAGAAKAGVKHGRPERLDVALIVSERPCTAAAVFTTNQVIAAPCLVTRRHVDRGPLRAIVVNSGNANACTGEQGERDAVAMAEAAAAVVECSPFEVAVASTGVIGFKLPVERIAAVLPGIELTEGGWDDTSRAMMTTDTRPKVTEREMHLSAGTVRIGGIAKGAGMIHPNMATLLAFVTTDAAVDEGDLRRIVSHVADTTFNAISIDGDTSTNDTLLVLANGHSGVTPKGADLALFEEGLHTVCADLARMIVADGEGATKVFEVRSRRAPSRTRIWSAQPSTAAIRTGAACSLRRAARAPASMIAAPACASATSSCIGAARPWRSRMLTCARCSRRTRSRSRSRSVSAMVRRSRGAATCPRSTCASTPST
jgi:glutamate N-acetyltransferase/amino-acid N-acetyltransferase